MMFDIGDKIQRITDGLIGIIKSDALYNGRYQVQFDNGEVSYLSESLLMPYQEMDVPTDLFKNCKFYGIDHFRRILSFKRLTGGLTNIFYSMNNINTEYLPHQFLPVTKFLQSPEERILIADEVGLGKTIEALYIWKEIEVRRNAKRLLVVCPASLREKWKRDMQNLFDISPEIVKADELIDAFERIEKRPNREQFAYICSIESIRSKKIDGYRKIDVLNNKFEEFAVDKDWYAFDLTIIDEAHYLRNRDTANFKTGERLREISESFLLLSATPIQTASTNLYSLMNILAPEQFDNESAFANLLEKDSVFIQLANCLQRSNVSFSDFQKIVDENSNNEFLKDNRLIADLFTNHKEIFNNIEMRMNYAEELRKQVFYYNLFNRTRRRFVFENTAKRDPKAVQFNLSEEELNIYNQVTYEIRKMAYGQPQILTFALISRQRQMASCLPAAFKAWKYEFASGEDENEEYDFISEREISEKEDGKKDENLNVFYNMISIEFSDIDYEYLKKIDSKYKRFLESIKELLSQNPKEKIIVFSFFRGTNEYLEERLAEDGISTVAIKGGMGDEKDRQLERFRIDDSINILISSEVGSEGLDLQFSNVEYNYDLPWNPMRLEQRIGRIDRIGQKAEKLRIYNLACQNTIEDRVLERLYNRVEIFKNSIGDLEDIVGQPIQELALEFLNPNLSDMDRDDKAEQKIQVLIKQRQMNAELEESAILLEQYRQMVLDGIKKSKTNKRYIDVKEMKFLIKDFFEYYYPGTYFFSEKSTKNTDDKYYKLIMSDKAKSDFKEFRRKYSPIKSTEIDSSSGVVLGFGISKENKRKVRCEIIDIDHPIFDWIRVVSNRQPQKAFGCSALSIEPISNLIEIGKYVYYIQIWKMQGAENAAELKYFICNVENGDILDENKSETIMNTVLTDGQTLENIKIKLSNFESFFNAAQKLINYAWDKFDSFDADFKRKNEYKLQRRISFINFVADKKIKTLKETVEKLRFENKGQRVINMNEKHIDKIENERRLKLKELEKIPETEISDIAIGALLVEDRYDAK